MSRWLTARFSIALTISAFTFVMMGAGVPDGANMPAHGRVSKPGTVAPTAGRSGIVSSGLSPITAIARSRPALRWPWLAAVSTNMNWTRPPMRSVIAGGVLLYGTGSESSLAAVTKYAPFTCPVLLPNAYEVLPGFAFTYAISSGTVFTLTVGLTASTNM